VWGEQGKILTPMCPSLSSLIRQILLESSQPTADEAVVVQPASLQLSRMGEVEQDRTAKKAHAYVSTSRWREGVIRTYTFLDGHSGVSDVVVIPFAISSSEVSGLMPRRPRGNLEWVSDRRTAAAQLERYDIDIPDRDDVITVVALTGSVTHGPDRLPSSWILVHAMFDRSNGDLLACEEVAKDLHRLLHEPPDWGTRYFTPIPLLLNCGWSENSFHMLTAALHHNDHSRGYRGVMDNMMDSPAVGKRYKSHEDVPIRDENSPPRSSGSNYVQRSKGDVVAEIMTIAVTKPSGFQPVLSRMSQIPDDIMTNHIMYTENDPRTRDLRAKIWRQMETDRTKGRLMSLEAADRKAIEGFVLDDLEEIKMLTHNLRDRLVHDLLGKVVFVTVS
jgi:hypothetical protein